MDTTPYNYSFQKLRDIRKASSTDLEMVPSAGKSVAEDIKREVSG